MEDQITKPPEGEEGQLIPEGSSVLEVAAEKPEGETEVVEAPKTYSQEEYDSEIKKLKEDWNSKRQEHDKKHQIELAQLRQQTETMLTQERERNNAAFLAKVEADGGDVNTARQLLAREEAARQREQEAEAKIQTFQAYQQQIQEEAKAIAAHRGAEKYGVDEKELLKAQSPQEMENIALKLQVEKLKTEQKRTIKTDSGVSSAKGLDLSKMSPEDKIGFGLTHQK